MGRLRMGRVLGRRETGTATYLCTDSVTHEMVARKSISKEALDTGVQDVEDVLQEIAIMKHLPRHPNIVSYKGSYDDDNDVHLVMEQCELFDHIAAIGHLHERRAAALMRSIVEVVPTLHEHGIIHRDQKPENLLFANKNVLKTIDFGLSVYFKPGQKLSEIAGTPDCMAPEIEQRVWAEVDMWSAGVILHMMPSQLRAFYSETDEEIREEILVGALDLDCKPWPRVSDSAKSSVRHMLERDPNTRYTAQEVLYHPWLQQNA